MNRGAGCFSRVHYAALRTYYQDSSRKSGIIEASGQRADIVGHHRFERRVDTGCRCPTEFAWHGVKLVRQCERYARKVLRDQCTDAAFMVRIEDGP